MQRLALTPGDPTGVGPEITLKALHRMPELPPCHITVVGSREALERNARMLGVALPNHHVDYLPLESELPGIVAYRSIEKAVGLIVEGKADSLVTGPISKQNLHDAQLPASGHTEILEELSHRLFQTPDACAEMLFEHKKLRLLLLTRHIPLKEVSVHLAKPGAIARPLKTLIRYLREQRNVSEPRIAMLGCNPHAGEIGGEEEKKYILPVMRAVNAVGNTKLDGPYPADGYFRGLDPNHLPHDAIVACYHDQGLIPFKMLAGYEAVNVTIGLPFLRTSVSHGTAEDIVGRGVAREDSLMAAVRAALDTKTSSDL